METKFFNVDYEQRSVTENFEYYCLVIYDIENNKRRNKLIKILNNYGKRVQKSAFEFNFKKQKYDELCRKIENYYSKEDNDQIRIYKFTSQGAIIIYGDEELVQSQTNVII